MSFYDDRIIYDAKNDCIWVGGPDCRSKGEPWQWFLFNGDICWRPKGFKPSKSLIVLDRQPEKTLYGYGYQLSMESK